MTHIKTLSSIKTLYNTWYNCNTNLSKFDEGGDEDTTSFKKEECLRLDTVFDCEAKQCHNEVSSLLCQTVMTQKMKKKKDHQGKLLNCPARKPDKKMPFIYQKELMCKAQTGKREGCNAKSWTRSKVFCI